MAEPLYFLTLLRRTRDTFPGDITPEEAEHMQAHAEYMSNYFDTGRAITIGPCLDYAYGVCIFEADSLEAAQKFADSDPAVTSDLMTAELHPYQAWRLRGRD